MPSCDCGSSLKHNGTQDDGRGDIYKEYYCENCGRHYTECYERAYMEMVEGPKE